MDDFLGEVFNGVVNVKVTLQIVIECLSLISRNGQNITRIWYEARVIGEVPREVNIEEELSGFLLGNVLVWNIRGMFHIGERGGGVELRSKPMM